MQREYLFRGHTGKNGWIYGDLIKSESGSMFILPVEEQDVTNYIKVKPNTVGQYLGIKSKNKKMIFEDDICIGEKGYMPSRGYKKKNYPNRIKVICVVEWSIYDAGWRNNVIRPIKEHVEYDLNAPYDYYFTSLSGSSKGIADWLEIVGNIHDNPELLNSL